MIHCSGVFLALLTILTVCFFLFLPSEMLSAHFLISLFHPDDLLQLKLNILIKVDSKKTNCFVFMGRWKGFVQHLSSINAAFEESRCLAISLLSESIKDLKKQKITWWEGVFLSRTLGVSFPRDLCFNVLWTHLSKHIHIWSSGAGDVTNDTIRVINGGHSEKHIHFAQNLFCFIYSFLFCNQGVILLWPFEILPGTSPFMHEAFLCISGLSFSFMTLFKPIVYSFCFCVHLSGKNCLYKDLASQLFSVLNPHQTPPQYSGKVVRSKRNSSGYQRCCCFPLWLRN